MIVEIKLEKLSGHTKEGKIGKINIHVGDSVNIGDVLFNIESSKGNTPLKSTISGKIESIDVEEGMTINIGDILAKIDGEQEKSDTTNVKKTYDYFNGMVKPTKQELKSDITIIGGGPGGYVAAIQAAKLGSKVVLVEKENLGGTCLNWGCIPTKALVRSAQVYKSLKQASSFGLHAESISVDMKKVIERKNGIVKQLVQGIDYLLEKNNVKVLKGIGEIRDKDTVYIKNGRTETTVKSNNIIIATGSKTSSVPIQGLDSKYVLTNKEALDLEILPHKLVVVGGGIIGMEFAFIYANFGVEVSVIEFLPDILAILDDDICDEIRQAALDCGIKIYTNAKVEAIMESEDDQCIVSFTKDAETKFITTDKVLVAIGREPFLADTGIETLGIELNEKGKGIKVNDRMQTNISNIYAIGDVTNKIQLAHVASHQGIVAVNNILGNKMEMDYNSIPSAIFTDPEIATVGICEKSAQEKSIAIEIGKFPFSSSGKALTLGETKGFVKMITEKCSGKIIGGAIIGPHATDLVAEITVAVKNGLTAKQLIETIHAHPTTSEALHEATLATTKNGAIHYAE